MVDELILLSDPTQKDCPHWEGPTDPTSEHSYQWERGKGNKKQIDFPSGSAAGKKILGFFLPKALRRHIKKDEIEQRVSTWWVMTHEGGGCGIGRGSSGVCGIRMNVFH